MRKRCKLNCRISFFEVFVGSYSLGFWFGMNIAFLFRSSPHMLVKFCLIKNNFFVLLFFLFLRNDLSFGSWNGTLKFLFFLCESSLTGLSCFSHFQGRLIGCLRSKPLFLLSTLFRQWKVVLLLPRLGLVVLLHYTSIPKFL